MRFAFYIVVAVVVLVLVAGQARMFGGQQPADIGVKEGRFKPPSSTRNSVSSQSSLHPEHPQHGHAAIAPLPYKRGGAEDSMRTLGGVLSAMPRVKVMEQRPDYLYAQAHTRWLKFVDDLEFWSNPAAGVIELRSASRRGREDFGVNRQRIEAIRAAYLAAP